MKNTFTFFVLALFVCFYVNQSFAQLTVDAQSEVGIGATNPLATLHVSTKSGKPANESIRNVHYYNGASAKTGIYNHISSAGTGSHRGHITYVFGNSSSTKDCHGYFASVKSHKGKAWAGYFSVNGASATDSYNKTAVRAYINAKGSGNKYGLYSTVKNNSTSGNSYGIYASAKTYAGYFAGNVHVTGTFTQPSDRKLKENIAEIPNALSIIDQLEPKSYLYKQDIGMPLPVGKQYGFIAQDLEQVLPDAVQDMQALLKDESEARRVDDTVSEEEALQGKMPEEVELHQENIKSVNYISLIPIMVKAMKEQQAEIEAQRREIEQLKAKLK